MDKFDLGLALCFIIATAGLAVFGYCLLTPGNQSLLCFLGGFLIGTGIFMANKIGKDEG